MTSEEATAFEKKHANALTKEGVTALREKVARGATLDAADVAALLDTCDVLRAWCNAYHEGWEKSAARGGPTVIERASSRVGRRDGRSHDPGSRP